MMTRAVLKPSQNLEDLARQAETWDLWERAKADLALQTDPRVFAARIERTVLLGLDGGKATIGTYDPSASFWLGSRLAPVITRTLGRLVGRPVLLRVELLEAIHDGRT